MDNRMIDQLTRRVASTPSRRSLIGRGFVAMAGALPAVGLIDGEAGKKKKKHRKGPQGAGCDPTPKLCSSSDECCGGRVCAQNGCAHPDRPRCCAGIGQPCSGNSCECCGLDLDCQNKKCVYAPR